MPNPREAHMNENLNLRLPVHAGTAVAEDWRVRLVIAADSGAGIRVDATDTLSIGQAVLQLMAAARAETRATGQDFAIDHLDPALCQRLVQLGLAECLGLDANKDCAL